MRKDKDPLRGSASPRLYRWMDIRWVWVLWALSALFGSNEATASDSRREKATTGLRKALSFYEKRQTNGGWASHYAPDLTKRWGEWRPTHPNVVTIQDSGTTGIGLLFVQASHVLKEPRWLDVARETGELLIQGQLPNGGFTQELQITPESVQGVHQLLPYPETPRPDSQGVLENNATDRAIELLLVLFDATGDKKYLDAARKAVDFLVAAQFPCGAFPQRHPSSDGYDKYFTLNDGATTDSILRLISFYRRTGQDLYLHAARKGGTWLLSAVLPDPTPGWAEQYDHANAPAKARSFEPPGVGTEITVMAVEALTELYLLTGDRQFLKPVEKAWKWLEATQTEKGSRSL